MSSQKDIVVGDKYHRSDKRATATVVRVTATHVEWECVQGCNSWRSTDTLENFRRLEAKSLKWGAVFEPAPNSDFDARLNSSARPVGNAAGESSKAGHIADFARSINLQNDDESA